MLKMKVRDRAVSLQVIFHSCYLSLVVIIFNKEVIRQGWLIVLG